ncbi:helix-turn-helix domain-containing protein [Plesiomonas shigelloides]|uniref:helix-turn-helix transcriptional regulator n=1 Tax=Plesiomonas shigelloides TaxID=703 RepID=UPI000D135E5A
MLISTRSAAKMLNVSPSTIERLRRNPSANFPAPIRVSDSCVRYDEAELLEWVKGRQEVAA